MTETNEARSAQRYRTLKGGRIVFNEARSTIDCTVRNLSDSGAKLKVASVVGIPDSFELQLGERLRRCRVVWREMDQLGVEFERTGPGST